MSSGARRRLAHPSEKAIRSMTTLPRLIGNLAHWLSGDHNSRKGRSFLTKSLQSDPLNAWALTYAAYAELQTQKFRSSRHPCESSAWLGPHQGLASVHIVAAHALEATAAAAETLKEYKLYMEEDPKTARDAAPRQAKLSCR